MRTLFCTSFLLLFAACDMLRSDAGNASHQAAEARKEALAAMKIATEQTPKGAFKSGDALRALVSDRTFLFVYGVTPDGRHERYVEAEYFRPDGRFVYRNSIWAKEPDGRAEDKWRIDGEKLCIVNTYMTPEERCFTIAVQNDGRVQYYTDGLLTKVTDGSHGGPAKPSEF